MPTLEVQLNKALEDFAAIPHVNTAYWYGRRRRADDYHGDDAKARGLMERIHHLQQRIEARNERAERHAAAQALMQLSLPPESIDLPTDTSAPTPPE
jgi:hypothetical protein